MTTLTEQWAKALIVACPRCGVGPGARCRKNDGGTAVDLHLARLKRVASAPNPETLNAAKLETVDELPGHTFHRGRCTKCGRELDELRLGTYLQKECPIESPVVAHVRVDFLETDPVWILRHVDDHDVRYVAVRESLARAFFNDFRVTHPGELTWETWGDAHKGQFHDRADVAIAWIQGAGGD